jgi:hypothetical protein
MSAIYRVRQFAQAVGAWFRPGSADGDLVARYLTPQAYALFRTMPRYDQQHALRVACSLQEQGLADPDLLAAALLHDVGKSASCLPGAPGRTNAPKATRLRLWHRVATVLMRALWPGLLERIGRDKPGSWRRAFYVQQHHAALGADLALQAGCSARAAALIRDHEDVPARTATPGETGSPDPLLAALQAADSSN